MSKPKPKGAEKKIRRALKAEAASLRVDVTPQKLKDILKRAKGNDGNK